MGVGIQEMEWDWQSLTIVCFENHKSQGPADMSSWSNTLIKNCLFMSENNRPNNN